MRIPVAAPKTKLEITSVLKNLPAPNRYRATATGSIAAAVYTKVFCINDKFR